MVYRPCGRSVGGQLCPGMAVSLQAPAHPLGRHCCSVPCAHLGQLRRCEHLQLLFCTGSRCLQQPGAAAAHARKAPERQRQCLCGRGAVQKATHITTSTSNTMQWEAPGHYTSSHCNRLAAGPRTWGLSLRRRWLAQLSTACSRSSGCRPIWWKAVMILRQGGAQHMDRSWVVKGGGHDPEEHNTWGKVARRGIQAWLSGLGRRECPR